jgi:hypothetical protein
MQRWDYLFVVGMLDAEGAWSIGAINGAPPADEAARNPRFSEYLNARGAEGWELIQILYGPEMGLSLVFKRPDQLV